MENFISHERSVVELDPGVTVIVGPNGAGKTSIVDAITFTLFDTHSRGKGNTSLVRKGASRALVEVEFSIGSSIYRVRREVVRRGTSESLLYRLDGGGAQLVARGIKSVQREISRLFSLNSDIARKLLIAGQGELEEILNRKKRREYIDMVIGVKAVEKTWENLRFVYNEVEKELRILEEKKKQLEARLEVINRRINERKTLEEKLTILRKDKADLENRLAEVELDVEALEEKTASLISLERDYARLEEEEKQLNLKAGELEARLAEIAEAEKEHAWLARILEYREQLEKYQLLAKLFNELSDSLKHLYSELKSLSREPVDVETVRERVRELQEKIGAISDKVEKMQRYYNEYLGLKKELEHYREELRKTNIEMNRIANLFKRIVVDVLGVSPENIGIDNPVSIYEMITTYREEVEEELRKTVEKIEQYSRELGGLESKIRDLEERLYKLASARRRCPLCGQELDEKHRLSLIKSLREEKQRLERMLSDIKRELAVLKQREEMLRQKYVKASRAIERLSRHRGSYDQLVERSKQLKSKIESVESRLIEIMPLAQEYRSAQEELARVSNELRKYLKIHAIVSKIVDEEKKIKSIKEEMNEIEERLLHAGIISSVNELKGLVEELNSLIERKARLDQLISMKNETLNALREIKHRMSEIESEKRKLSLQIEKLRVLKNELDEKKQALEELKERLRHLEREEARIEERLKEIEEYEREAESIGRAIIETSRKIDGVRSVLDDIKLIRSVLRDTVPKIVRMRAKNLVEYHMRRILRSFNIDFIDIKLDDEYEPIVYGRLGERNLSMLSGGEKIAIAIAFRLALIAVMAPRSRLLVLDEPTVFLDEENKRELVRIIRDSMQSISGLEQLVIVSHDRELEEAADQVIEVYRDNTGVSKVVKRMPGEAIEV